jgi:hypothetical protein
MSAHLRPARAADSPGGETLPAALPTVAGPLDGWIVPPHTAARRKRGRGSERRPRKRSNGLKCAPELTRRLTHLVKGGVGTA